MHAYVALQNMLRILPIDYALAVAYYVEQVHVCLKSKIDFVPVVYINTLQHVLLKVLIGLLCRIKVCGIVFSLLIFR